MHVRNPLFCLWLLGAIGALAAGGCADMRPFKPLNPSPQLFHAQVTPPYLKVEKLQQLEAQAADMDAAERESRSAELAQVLTAEEDPLLRAQLLRTLGKLKTQTAETALLAAANDPENNVRMAACRAWVDQGGPQAAQALSNFVQNDADKDVQLAAARSLGELRDPAGTQALGMLLEQRDPALQQRAMDSLAQITDQDFGYNAEAWRQYVKGETPALPEQGVAERVRGWFKR